MTLLPGEEAWDPKSTEPRRKLGLLCLLRLLRLHLLLPRLKRRSRKKGEARPVVARPVTFLAPAVVPLAAAVVPLAAAVVLGAAG